MVKLSDVKVGNKVRVIDHHCGNQFKYGEIVTVVHVGDYDIKAEGRYGVTWYLHPAEFQLYRAGDIPNGKVRVDFIIDEHDLRIAVDNLGAGTGGYGTYKGLKRALYGEEY